MASLLNFRATRFEQRHGTLLRQLIVAAAFSTYLFDRDDIVWRFVRESEASRAWERLCFLLATILILFGGSLCTWARANRFATGENASSVREGPYRFIRYPERLGDMLFTIGIASLAPLSGALLLVAGEALRLLRLILRQEWLIRDAARRGSLPSASEPRSLRLVREQSRMRTPNWVRALRHEAVRWGIFITMVVFTATLIDRLAEVMAGASLVAAALLNLRLHRTNELNPNELSQGETE